MSEANPSAPKWFWVVAILALIWNLLGLAAFFMEINMGPEHIAKLPAAEQALYADIPLWATIAFAVAVCGGTLGCIGLLLRKAWSIPLLVASVVGVVVQFFHSFLLSDVIEVYGPSSVIMPLGVLVIAVLLVILARSANAKGWFGGPGQAV